MNNDDLELLSRYAHNGANDAFEVLFRRHGNLVHSTALRIVGSRSAAEDVSQAVFIELVRAAPRLKPDTGLAASRHPLQGGGQLAPRTAGFHPGA